MYCTNCGKDLPENSKFCNHCGASQDTVGEPSPETQIEQQVLSKRQKRKMTKKKPGCLSVAFVLFSLFIIFACFMASTEESETKNSDTQNSSVTVSTIDSPIEISATKLVKAYIDNEVKADTLYDDKAVIINGYVNRIEQTDYLLMENELIVYVGTGEDIENCLRCYVSTEQKEIVAELEVGDKITVTGRCVGLGSSYFNLKCVNIYDGVISE